MARVIAIGLQDFEKMISNHYFYIDKTDFIRAWWENGDDVTLITRPRRFGKTLAMDMVERFFSVKYGDGGKLFEELSIWKDEKYRRLQGTYPVISISFGTVKEADYQSAVLRVNQLITDLYRRSGFLLEGDFLSEKEKEEFRNVSMYMPEVISTMAIYKLAEYFTRYYGKKVIILLDEYDTPLQEAYVKGYWQEMTEFMRKLLNSAFKTNQYMERAILTGITRISKESIFSDLNNMEVVTATSEKYETFFGFTQQEVREALQEYGLEDKEQAVKDWYDGFTFGNQRDIYNPWSILNFLEKRRFLTWWANTSSNSLVNKLIQEGDRNVKISMEELLRGGILRTQIDEQIVFSQLEQTSSAIWSLLLAGGYLKIEDYFTDEISGKEQYTLALTNREVRLMFERMIEGWFSQGSVAYNDFIKALLCNDIEAMNAYMNDVAFETFSYFDTGRNAGKTEPERFYHGFVLGLMVDLADRYLITSNRESGFGRYDVILEPRRKNEPAFLLEFKVFNPKKEKTLEDTVEIALKQIEDKKYAALLEAKGIAPENIKKYGFAFEGKKVLIG